MPMKNNNEQIEDLLRSVSNQLGADKETILKAAKNGNLQDIVKNMNSNDAQKIQKVLSDKDVASKLLSTPQAQQLLKTLLGDK